MNPTVGRIVHYQSYGTPGGEYLPAPRAAVVTAVPELLPEQPNSGPPGYVPAVSLCILNPTGLFLQADAGPLELAAAVKCRHCHQPVVKFPGGWWHIIPGQTYRACRDEAGRLIGSTLAEPAEDVA